MIEDMRQNEVVEKPLNSFNRTASISKIQNDIDTITNTNDNPVANEKATKELFLKRTEEEVKNKKSNFKVNLLHSSFNAGLYDGDWSIPRRHF